MSFVLRHATRNVCRSSRTFTTTAITRKDLVQDLYLKELKAYKPIPVAKDAHVGSVKVLSIPKAPQVPALPADLASELTAYDAAEPTKAALDGKAASTEHHHDAAEGAGTGADTFLHFLEADIPKAEAHH